MKSRFRFQGGWVLPEEEAFSARCCCAKGALDRVRSGH